MNNVLFENCKIIFRNFDGKASKFNAEGNRNFCILIEPERGKLLQEEGWNIKWLKPKEEEDVETPYLQVTVSYKNMPPKILMVSKENKTLMTEANISMLDWVEIVANDIIVKPYQWDVNGKTGVKAYVKDMYVILPEDPFSEKYKDLPENG